MSISRSVAGATLALATALLLGGCSLFAPQPASEQDDDFGTVSTYEVQHDGSLIPQPTGLSAEIWKTFTRITSPQIAATVMLQFRVGNAPASDTLAYVYQDTDHPKAWVLAANLATSEDHDQLIATLIHEYGHILTLNTEQMAADSSSCPILNLDEGCAAGDSMLRAFYDQFWSHYGTSAPDASNSDADVAYKFYLANEDDFVDDYAATNVVEDTAETFSTWVLEKSSEGDSRIAQKLRFFDAYPQMVAIRERIRQEFAGDLGLGG